MDGQKQGYPQRQPDTVYLRMGQRLNFQEDKNSKDTARNTREQFRPMHIDVLECPY